jgi:hypothetical protein
MTKQQRKQSWLRCCFDGLHKVGDRGLAQFLLNKGHELTQLFLQLIYFAL